MFKLVLSLCLVALAAASPLADDQTRSGRIVGGNSAVDGQFPFMTSIRQSGVHYCGGALVSARWVVTAAHCMSGRTINGVTAVVGSARLSGGTSYGVSRIVIHFDFTPVIMDDDISMVEISTPVVFTANVQPAQLGSGSVGSGVTVVAVGFGQTSNPGSFSETLQFMSAPTITNTNCRSRFGITNAVRVQEEHVCTLSPIGQGLCLGDGGTPIVIGNNLIGVNSWGIPCALGSPDVHTRISSFRVWISVISGL